MHFPGSGFPQDLLSILHRSQISRQSDLTKSQCYDSQIVTTESEYRNTNNYTEYSGHCCTDQDC